MNQKSVLKFIENNISTISGNPSIKVGVDDSINTIKEWDSLVTMTLGSTLGSEYGIDLDIDDIEKISSVKGIFSLLGVEK